MEATIKSAELKQIIKLAIKVSLAQNKMKNSIKIVKK